MSDEWFENNELTRKARKSRRSRRNSVNECEIFNDKDKDSSKKSSKASCSNEDTNDKLNTENTNKNSKSASNEKVSFEAEDSEEYKAHFNINVPSRVYADTYIRKNAAKWKSTPVPGMLTCSEYDQYGNEAIQPYDRVYEKNRGVLPKYGGYVPGLKFRYGSPFGQLTYNARELGFTKSRTWGGAVSLF